MQVNEVLETLLQQLQAHNHPHAGAVQAAINLAGAAPQGQKGLYASQVTPPPPLLHSVICIAVVCIYKHSFVLCLSSFTCMYEAVD